MTPSGGGPAPAATLETRLAKLFGLGGDNWMRHANPDNPTYAAWEY